MYMKLQLALDRLTEKECLSVLEETKESIDIIEVGTGVIKEYGMSIVRTIRELYPDRLIVADMKTCDAGKHEALQAFEAEIGRASCREGVESAAVGVDVGGEGRME